MPASVEERLARLEERVEGLHRLLEDLGGDLDRERSDLRELVAAGDRVIFTRLDFVGTELKRCSDAVAAEAKARENEAEVRAKNRTTVAVAVIGGSVTVLAAVIAAVAAILSAT